jgi:hypothetical protein
VVGWNQTFRSTVLATSATWLTGNITEAGLRSVVARAGPRSYLTGLRALSELRKMDPEDRRDGRWRARWPAGTWPSPRRRSATRTPSSSRARTLRGARRGDGQGLAAHARAEGDRRLLEPLHGVRLQLAQRPPRVAVPDRHARPGAPRLADDGASTCSSCPRRRSTRPPGGCKETPTQIAFGREIDRMYGKYGKFSPGMRHAVAYYTPFLAWSLNAVTFVYSVLPKDHPVVTSLIALDGAGDRGVAQGPRPGSLHGRRRPGLPSGLDPPFGGAKNSRSGASRRSAPSGTTGRPWPATCCPRCRPCWTSASTASTGRARRCATQRPAARARRQGLAIGRTLVESTIPLVGLGERIAENGPKAPRRAG